MMYSSAVTSSPGTHTNDMKPPEGPLIIRPKINKSYKDTTPFSTKRAHDTNNVLR